jgi:hypothetical protein
MAYIRGERDLFAERKKLSMARRFLRESSVVYGLSQCDGSRARRFWEVVSLLQQDSRMSLPKMSRELGVSVTTLCEDFKRVRKFFRFTIVLKDSERLMVWPACELSYEFVAAPEQKELPLSMFT